jgi:hypothetical protein
MSKCICRFMIPCLLALTLLSASACAATSQSPSPTTSENTAGGGGATASGAVVSRSAGTVIVEPSPSQSPAQDQTSGVQGLAMIAGGPYPGSPRPVPHTSILVRRGGFTGRVAAKTTTDASGAFRVALPPGTYTVFEFDKFAPQTVTVEPGNYVTVTLMLLA